jgi:branched-subunit amino acid ABC-type transport system permease component
MADPWRPFWPPGGREPDPAAVCAQRQLGAGFFRLGAFAVLFFRRLVALGQANGLAAPQRVDAGAATGAFHGHCSGGGAGAGANLCFSSHSTLVWSPEQRCDRSPLAGGWDPGGGSLFLPNTRLFIIALTVFCILGLYFFLQRTRWGLRIRGGYPKSGHERLCRDPYAKGGCPYLLPSARVWREWPA